MTSEPADPGLLEVARRMFDLARFGHTEDGVLVCDQHGWRFDLETGRCLTSDDVSLYVQPVAAEETQRVLS